MTGFITPFQGVAEPYELGQIQVEKKQRQSKTKSNLLWLLNQGQISDEEARLIETWFRLRQKNSETGLQKSSRQESNGRRLSEIVWKDIESQDPLHPLVAIAAVHAIGRRRSGTEQKQEQETINRIGHRLLGSTRRQPAESNVGASETGFSGGQFEASPIPDCQSASPEAMWRFQLAEVEFPLACRANGMPDFGTDEAADLAIGQWSATVEQWLDLDGWPHAHWWSMFGPIVASWSRCFELARSMDLELHPDTESQLEWSARQLLRMLRPDGTIGFARSASRPVHKKVLDTILKMSYDLDDRKLAKRIDEHKFQMADYSRKGPAKNHQGKFKKLPNPSCISEWGMSGVLQSAWASHSPKVLFDYSDKGFAIEMMAKRILIAGDCMPTIEIGGALIQPQDDFELVCNEHDADLDYVELEMAMTRSVTLTRQLALSREESFLLVADSVILPEPMDLNYRCCWPLADSIRVIPETETRELYLGHNKIQGLVLPLSLPEWKVGPSVGKLQFDDLKMMLSHRIHARAACIPLVFDLNPKRSKQKRTWRQLTVAENRKPIPGDQAAAFRFQLNRQQWFFYRALTSRGNRTFLGENFNGEFIINRFDEDGNVTELLSIE